MEIFEFPWRRNQSKNEISFQLQCCNETFRFWQKKQKLVCEPFLFFAISQQTM